ncbi:hypothetical protein ACLB2K_052960 [Fragaria x ananassa]
MPISHLLFADNSLFFLKATLDNCLNLSDILHTYISASGQRINTDKSSLFFSPNTPPQIIDLISSVLSMKIVTDPGRYLGLPTIWGRSKCKALSFVKDAIKKKVANWKQSLLNQAGKEVLIKSVASAIPAYTMSYFKFQKSTCQELNSTLSDFWWGNSTSSDIHWKAWDALGLPKSKGGFGFRNFKDFNDALLAKQVWRLHQFPNSLSAQVIKQIYHLESSILEAKKGASSSWLWNSLLVGKDLIRAETLWEIGNGKSVNFWSDQWVPSSPPAPICPARGNLRAKVETVINWQSNSWDLSLVHNHITPSTCSKILSIRLFNQEMEDKLIWPHTINGVYSVRSGYHYLASRKANQSASHPSHSHSPSIQLWKWFPKIKTLPKISSCGKPSITSLQPMKPCTENILLEAPSALYATNILSQ